MLRNYLKQIDQKYQLIIFNCDEKKNLLQKLFLFNIKKNSTQQFSSSFFWEVKNANSADADDTNNHKLKEFFLNLGLIPSYGSDVSKNLPSVNKSNFENMKYGISGC